MRDYNARQESSETQAGFYGLDLYSLYASVEAELNYLNKVDAEAARRARYRYSCFEHFAEDTQAYGYSAGLGLTEPCEEEVISQLLELQRLLRSTQAWTASWRRTSSSTSGKMPCW